MLFRVVEGIQSVEPFDFLLWLVAAAILAIVALSAICFIAECFCEWRTTDETGPNSPYFGSRSPHPRLRRRRIA